MTSNDYVEVKWETKLHVLNGSAVVDLKYAHPRLGLLLIERFQRTIENLDKVLETGKITYLGRTLKTEGSSVRRKLEFPELACDFYEIWVGDEVFDE